jgi:anti-sigma factor RsiW
MREGFNVVYWNDDGRGYLVIGKAPRSVLEAYAGTLAPRV